jgi:hypothetical protein
MKPMTVLGAGYALLCFYLDGMPSHVGADVDGLAYRLHHPTDFA